VKIDFENPKRASDIKAIKWKKTTKSRDQVFLATGIPPSPNTSSIIGDTWKWRLLWGFGTILSCSFPIEGGKLWIHLATWRFPYRFDRALSPVSAKLTFCQCAHVFTTLQCLCNNWERDPCSRSWFDDIHSTMGTPYTVRPASKRYTHFGEGSVHFVQKYWHPVRVHKGSALLCNTNKNRTMVFQFKNGETIASTKTPMEDISNGMKSIGRQI
jgi:hypothetical protein